MICCQEQPLKDTCNYDKDIGLCSCNQPLIQEHKGYCEFPITNFHSLIAPYHPKYVHESIGYDGVMIDNQLK